MSKENKEKITPKEARQMFREGLVATTSNWAPGYAQANLAILPREDAYDFLLFCFRNPKPCPILEVTEVGSPEPFTVAPGADLRTDLAGYRIFKNGECIEETQDITGWWRDDLVAFLIGCSFSFEEALINAGVPVRHIEKGKDCPIYKTEVDCIPAGRFSGPLVVSMRPVPSQLVSRAVTVTARFPSVHGSPAHIGNPEGLGIRDLSSPDWGDPPDINPGEVPMFWACGVTPQAVALNSKPELMITHVPANMFITDVWNESLAAL